MSFHSSNIETRTIATRNIAMRNIAMRNIAMRTIARRETARALWCAAGVTAAFVASACTRHDATRDARHAAAGGAPDHIKAVVSRPPQPPPAWQTAHVLRVCADPNNLPFSNRREEGFENRLAQMVARDLGARVEYTWWPQRRGFVRNTLKARKCDLVMGVPAGYEMTQNTSPYYRSTYVFVTRRDRHLSLHSFDDPQLRTLRIGFHVMGDDYANSPAELALARRGIEKNVVGYSIYGDYTKPDPPADLVRAVTNGDVDVAVVWGPLAGYFAQRSSVPLTVTPVDSLPQPLVASFAYNIAAGVRHGDTLTSAMMERELARHHADVQQLLHSYGVPLLPVRGTYE